MKTTIQHSAFIFALIVGFSASAVAQNSAGDTVGTVTFTTVAPSDWRITEVDGNGVATHGSTNTMTLEVGGRYTFDLSDVDSESYPMEIRDSSGTVLVSQRNNASSEEFEAADISVTEEEIQFTLTEDLASRIAFYRAATYPSMIGIIRTYSQEQDEEPSGD